MMTRTMMMTPADDHSDQRQRHGEDEAHVVVCVFSYQVHPAWGGSSRLRLPAKPLSEESPGLLQEAGEGGDSLHTAACHLSLSLCNKQLLSLSLSDWPDLVVKYLYSAGLMSARHNRVMLTLPHSQYAVAVLTCNLPSFPPSLPHYNPTPQLTSVVSGVAVAVRYIMYNKWETNVVLSFHLASSYQLSNLMSLNIVTVQSTYHLSSIP